MHVQRRRLINSARPPTRLRWQFSSSISSPPTLDCPRHKGRPDPYERVKYFGLHETSKVGSSDLMYVFSFVICLINYTVYIYI